MLCRVVRPLGKESTFQPGFIVEADKKANGIILTALNHRWQPIKNATIVVKTWEGLSPFEHCRVIATYRTLQKGQLVEVQTSTFGFTVIPLDENLQPITQQCVGMTGNEKKQYLQKIR